MFYNFCISEQIRFKEVCEADASFPTFSFFVFLQWMRFSSYISLGLPLGVDNKLGHTLAVARLVAAALPAVEGLQEIMQHRMYLSIVPLMY